MSSLRVVVAGVDLPDPFGNAAGRWYYVLALGLTFREHSLSSPALLVASLAGGIVWLFFGYWLIRETVQSTAQVS